MKVLVCGPALDRQGGVASFLAAILPHLGEVRYFTLGSRSVREGFPVTLARMGRDYLRFVRAMFLREVEVVHLNPSLASRALWRDALFLLLARLAGKKVVVFFHGWNERCERRLEGRLLPFFRFAFFRASAILVLASRFEGKLRRWGYAGPVLVETTAVDDAFFRQAAGDRREGPRILFLSRLEREKGVYEALRAFAL